MPRRQQVRRVGAVGGVRQSIDFAECRIKPCNLVAFELYS